MLGLPAGSGSAKELSEARERQADIQVAVKENERELAKYKVGSPVARGAASCLWPGGEVC